ncbi:MAG: TetR/AcrR family transcriptional regulator [Leptospiraceae bacterium]|nr:TetR/AcrR family transcriptional regulator [Leptospiraceae bacterium]MCP5501038.1 TetR/AcrR family transcriptional regulator [Leptospiraceae bacterium]
MGVKERKQKEFQKREDKIIKMAILLFRKNHPSLVSMDTLAKKLEIGRGTLYLHFKSKDDLMAKIVVDFYRTLREKMQAIDVNLDPAREIRSAIRTYIEHCLDDKTLYQVVKKCSESIVVNNLPPETIQEMEFERKERLVFLESIYKNAKKQNLIEEAPPFVYVGASWGMLSGAIDILLDGHFKEEILDAKQYMELVETIFFRGLFKK